MQNMKHLQQFSEVQVTAVCDVNRESGGYLSWNWSQGRESKPAGREPARRMIDEYYASRKNSGTYRACRSYRDFRELLDREDVDAVMIATPDHTHAVITMAALKRGKHVYCEKPLTYSVYEARQVMKDLAEYQPSDTVLHQHERSVGPEGQQPPQLAYGGPFHRDDSPKRKHG